MLDEQLDLFDSAGDESSPVGEPAEIDLGRFPHPPQLADNLYLAGLSRGRIRLASDLVALESDVTDDECRALFLAVAIGLEAQARGSTFVPLPSRSDYIERRLREVVPEELRHRDTDWEPLQLAERIEELLVDGELRLVGRDGEFKPLVISDGRLYHQRMWLHERRLVDAVSDRLQRRLVDRDVDEVEAALDDVRSRQPPAGSGGQIELNPEQEYALLTALHRPMTLITGGPGTGKTSIVVSILRMLVRLGVAPKSIALAAPTGKAANRMAESIYGQLDAIEELSGEDQQLFEELESPKTLHRLMGYSPGRDEFSHHPDNPLSHRMVVVDEASMIDLFLMERLLRAVSPTAQLVLLGDADQLPSVDTGAVLRDLIPKTVSTDAHWHRLVAGELAEQTGEAPTADFAMRLRTSYRMREENPAGREILGFAQSIRDFHKGGQLEMPEEFSGGEQVPDGVRNWPVGGGASKLDDFVDWWFSKIVLDGGEETWKRRMNFSHRLDGRGRLDDDSRENARRLLDHFARARILTLTRVFATGSEAINARLHRTTERLGYGRSDADYVFHPGEPVMMLRNDYERNLFNGDQGVVVWCEQPDEAGGTELSLRAVFRRADRLVSFPVAELYGDLEHAFAMTVHKSQGSEFERIAVVLPDRPMSLLNRELLYTGVTRAGDGVLLVGDPQMVRRGAATHSERFSAVGERLRRR